ncbi:hypothetical protein [Marivita sp.]|uniref:sulfotransferase-like domain-containing protein n=1 Tax=Marivita sp. TaxID=2003365 RepID=UPI0025BF3F28|nr:hypothetical protein [Marivita sp.]
MTEFPTLDLPDDPKLTHNIVHFTRALRAAGLPVGTGRVIDAVRAVAAAGFTSRRDFFYTLRACLVTRPEHLLVFSQVFRLYWRDPRYMEHMMAMMLPAIRGVQEERGAQAATAPCRRLVEVHHIRDHRAGQAGAAAELARRLGIDDHMVDLHQPRRKGRDQIVIDAVDEKAVPLPDEVMMVRDAGHRPVVIDSADIRRAPEPMLRLLCAAIGLPFDPSMLSWPVGGHEQDGVWASHWYGAVHTSDGFASAEGALPVLDGARAELADAAMPAYEHLSAYKLRIA